MALLVSDLMFSFYLSHCPRLVAQTPLYLERAREFFSLQYEFVTIAMVASVFLGALCGLVGTFLVLRSLSLLGDAVGHSTLPGLCAGFLIAGQVSSPLVILGALVSALLGALFVGFSARLPRARADASIGLVLALFFGAGIVMLSYIQRVATTSYAGLDSMLLGNVAGMTSDQLLVLLVAGSVLALSVVVFYRWLMITSFDPVFARVTGVPVRWVHYGVLVILSVCVVLAIQAVGVVLVSAMLIIPASAARFWARRLPGVCGLAMVVGAISGFAGAFFSYIFEGVPTGAAMVVVASLLFALSYFFGSLGGVVSSRYRKARSVRRLPVSPASKESSSVVNPHVTHEGLSTGGNS